MEELTLEQIMLILTTWIENGRITVVDGKLFVDNTLAMDENAANVVEPILAGYDKFGISLATTKHGGVSLEQLNDRLELDRASNDPLVAEQAQKFPQFFMINIDRGLTTEQAWNMLCSYNKQSFTSGMFGSKRLSSGEDIGTYMSAAYTWDSVKFVNKKTGEELPFVLRLTNGQHFSREWKVAPGWYSTTGKLENYLTYSQGSISGFWDHPDYETEHLARANERALRYYEQQIGAARRRAARIDDGSIPPTVGPRR